MDTNAQMMTDTAASRGREPLRGEIVRTSVVARVVLVALLAGGILATAGSALAGDCAVSLQHALFGDVPEMSAGFGTDVDVRGDVAIFGLPEGSMGDGAVEIYRLVGMDWLLDARLEAPPSNPGHAFGEAVAISGDWALVGTGQSDEAYFYRYDGSNWLLEQTLTGERFSRFGGAVDLDGSVAMIGAREANLDAGEVWFYRFDGSAWVEEARFLGSEEDAWFGSSVSVRGDRAVCGAEHQGELAGAAFVFEYDGTSWNSSELPQSAPENFTQFGTSVAISESGTTILVGQPEVDTGRGAAWIYKYDGSGWVERQRLVSDNRFDFEGFGSAVAVSDDLAIAGSPYRSMERGVGFVFRRVRARFEFANRIFPEVRNDDARFAAAIALDGTTAILGSPRDSVAESSAGSGHVFDVPLCPDVCKDGSIDTANGYPDDVLFVNGSPGNAPERTVDVATGERMWIAMLSAPAGSPGKFVVHANFAAPNASTTSTLPASIGTTCFEMRFNAGATPGAIWNNIGKETLVGATQDFEGNTTDPERTPCIFVELDEADVASLLPPGTIVTMQGILLDAGSLSPKAASVTNAVVVQLL